MKEQKIRYFFFGYLLAIFMCYVYFFINFFDKKEPEKVTFNTNEQIKECESAGGELFVVKGYDKYIVKCETVEKSIFEREIK